MTDATPTEKATDHRAAKADAKAAAARAKALRPWYKKKRFILGIPLGVLVLLMIASSAATTDEPESATTAGASGSSAPSNSVALEPTTEGPPRIGDIVSVGSLDLTVHSAEAYDTQQHNPFNSSNLRVEITATNARGAADEEYNITPWLYMSIVDENGIAHDADIACADCPDVIDSVDLVRGGTVTGYVYFEVPEGRGLVEVLYEPLFSTNKVRIALD